MGECIITRAGGGGNDIDSIAVIPGYHSLLVSLKTADGSAITNQVINCKDGNSWYNYTTNEKGQVLFTCNSGSANLYVSNTINGITYCDILPTNMNVDTPVGQKSIVNLTHNNQTIAEFTQSATIYILSKRNANVSIVGGGGGGGGAWARTRRDWEVGYSGLGGGAGYMNSYITELSNSYNFIAGSGGAGGSAVTNYNNAMTTDDYNMAIGKAGGISYIENTNMSATGGAGGRITNSYNTPAAGGLGNGGNGIQKAGNSPVSFAGGGGGYGISWRSPYNSKSTTETYIRSSINSNYTGNSYFKGTPYGGYGGIFVEYSGSGAAYGQYMPTSGSRGGGGGGMICYAEGDAPEYGGGSGGMGLLHIEFLNP